MKLIILVSPWFPQILTLTFSTLNAFSSLDIFQYNSTLGLLHDKFKIACIQYFVQYCCFILSYCNHLTAVKSRNNASVQYQQIIVGKISKVKKITVVLHSQFLHFYSIKWLWPFKYKIINVMI